MKIKLIFILLLLFSTVLAFGQKATLVSPNKAINIALYGEQDNNSGNWYLQVNNYNKDKFTLTCYSDNEHGDCKRLKNMTYITSLIRN